VSLCVFSAVNRQTFCSYFPFVGALISVLTFGFKITLEHKTTVLPSLTSNIKPGNPSNYQDLDSPGFLSVPGRDYSFLLAFLNSKDLF
jgi:hypothetical protein